MTPIDLAAVRKLADAATPGPWTAEPSCYVEGPDGEILADIDAAAERGAANAAFIAEARTIIPSMAGEIEALRVVVDAARALRDANARTYDHALPRPTDVWLALVEALDNLDARAAPDGGGENAMNDVATELLRVGDYLHASCSDAIYGEVIGLGPDENGHPSVDLRIFDADDLLSWPQAADDDGRIGGLGSNKEWPEFTGCASLELPPGVTIILRGLHHKRAGSDEKPGLYRWGKHPDSSNATHGDEATHVSTGKMVVVLTPGDGCFRCTKLFSVARRP